MSRRLIVLIAVAGPMLAGLASADPTATRVAKAMQLADQVVVGHVSAVQPSWKTNVHGDQLIVSRTWVRTEETLKGNAAMDVPVEIEGGTIGELTLTVSDMPTLKAGDRAVFLLKKTANGELIPHLRGAGILRVGKDDVIPALGLRLEDVRQLARQSR
jgi:hypothetical protein